MTIPLTQEPPFKVPFIDPKTKLIDPIWHLWLSGLFTTQNQQNSGISTNTTATANAQATANAAATPAQVETTVAQEQARAEAAEAANASAITTETTRAEAAEALLAPKASPTFTGTVAAPVLELSGATPTGTGSALGLGSTTGIGNGAAGNVQAPAKGTGTGPATPGTIVLQVEIDIGGTKFWLGATQ